MDSLPSGTPGHVLPVKVIDKIHMVDYIPHRIRSLPIDQSFIIGYSACYKAVYAVFERGDVPTVQAVMEELNSLAGDEGTYSFAPHYFKRGGRIEFVLNGVAHRSREEVRTYLL